MLYIQFICALLFFSWAGLADSSDYDTPSPKAATAAPQIPAYLAAPSPNLRFESFKTFLIDNKTPSIEAALAALVPLYPDYFKFQILVYKSRSRHGSSFKEPRVLATGSDAKFIVSFNGGFHQAKGNAFETVEYSDETKSNAFREIAFKNAAGVIETDLPAEEIELTTENFIISKANPSLCTDCHGVNPTHLWATYFLWPGIYGSNDDNLTRSFAKTPELSGDLALSDRPLSQGRLMNIGFGFADNELDGMIEYLKGKPTHPRYKYLPPLFADEGFLRFANGEPFSQLDYSAQAKQEYDRTGVQGWPTRPNLFMQLALRKLNQQRLIAKLQEANLRNKFNSAIWAKTTEDLKNVRSNPPWGELAVLIKNIISKFEFKGERPSLEQIEARLKTNFDAERGLQQDKLAEHESSFAPQSLQYIPDEKADRSHLLPWITDITAFYADLAGLSSVTELDRIAFNMQTDDQVLMTALEILLLDHGINLHEYSMNFASSALSFHVGGLMEVNEYLGIIGGP